MDPTSGSNLHCTGCWAAKYGNKLNLTLEELDSIITQAEELGCYPAACRHASPPAFRREYVILGRA